MRAKRAKEAPVPALPAPAPAEGEIGAQGRLVRLDEGIYSLSVGSAVAQTGGAAGIRFPIVNISVPPSDDHDISEIIGGSGDLFGWCEAGGGVVVVKVPPGGGIVLVTTYGPAGRTAAADVEVCRLGFGTADGRSVTAVTATAPAPEAPVPDALAAASGDQIRSEIILHIEREGDRRFDAQGWVGNRGQRRRVEAFSVRPLETLAAGDLEYKAFGPNGRETPWVTDAKLCGTRGRGLPLTGFAIRLASHLRDRYDVVYEGAFFDSGVAGPSRNGEPCVPSVFDDPLEAINLRVLARRSE